MIEIEVVSDEEAETADAVLCLRVGSPSPFTDNETGVCSVCGHPIFFRPYIPKNPPKICVQCFAGFTIAADGLSITCHHCGQTSHNLNDVQQRYCGFCHQFHEDPPNPQPKES